MEMAPTRRGAIALLRNRARRLLDRLELALGRRPLLHYITYTDREYNNRGDIAVRLASLELLHQAFGGAVELRAYGWEDEPDVSRMRAEASLFVLGGGGYYFFDGQGRLGPRVARDIEVMRQLRCPIVSLAPGVNWLLWDAREDAAIHPDARRELEEMLGLLSLSSVRDENGRRLLEQVSPGRTACLPDPALFLRPAPVAEAAALPRDGRLRVGLNLVFHGRDVSRTLLDRVALFAAAARRLAARRPCRFHYFVHADPERLVPALLRREGVAVEVVDTGPAEMLAWYGQLDLHLCQMLHSSILSLNAGVPTVNVGYDVKNAAFFDLMGLGRFCLNDASEGIGRLDAAVDAALEESEAIRRQVAERKVQLRRELDAYLARVVALARAGRQPAAASPPSIPTS